MKKPFLPFEIQIINFSIKITKEILILDFFGLIWIIYTLIRWQDVITSYKDTNLALALLTVDSIFFGALIIFISIIISSKYLATKNYIHFINISKSIAFLIFVNISSYFITGFLEILVIYYQLWALPTIMLFFYLSIGDFMEVNNEKNIIN